MTSERIILCRPLIFFLTTAIVLSVTKAFPASFAELREKFEAEKTKEAFDRLDTIKAFGKLDDPEVDAFLIGLLDAEENVTIRTATIMALGSRRTLEAVKGIVEKGVPLLTGKAVSEDTFEFLVGPALSSALSGPFSTEIETWLLENAFSDAVREHDGAFRVVVDAVIRLKSPERAKTLFTLLKKSRSAPNQVALLEIIAEHELKGKVKAASPFVKHRDLKVKKAALLLLLDEKPQKKLKKQYVKLLNSKDWELQVLGTLLLSKFRDAKLIKKFLKLFDSPRDPVKVNAVAAVVEVGTVEAVEKLIEALEDAEGRLRDDIADALARLTGVDLGANPAQWESWLATNRDSADVRPRSPEEYAQIRKSAAKNSGTSTFAVFYGLRVLSRKCAFLIDCSDSMKKPHDGEAPTKTGKLSSKLDVAKTELLRTLGSLDTRTQFNVIGFNSETFAWSKRLKNKSPKTLKNATHFIRTLDPGGMTNMHSALEIAFKDENVNTIYLLSDGIPTLGKLDVIGEVKKMNRLRRVKIHAIGVGLAPREEEFLAKLASDNGGVFISR